MGCRPPRHRWSCRRPLHRVLLPIYQPPRLCVSAPYGSATPTTTALHLWPWRLCVVHRCSTAGHWIWRGEFFFSRFIFKIKSKKKILKYNIIVVYCNFYEFNLYALILHCQPMTTMYSATSPHFFHMIQKIGDFLLDDRVKLFYTVSA
jgi:hypothetical protein